MPAAPTGHAHFLDPSIAPFVRRGLAWMANGVLRGEAIDESDSAEPVIRVFGLGDPWPKTMKPFLVTMAALSTVKAVASTAKI